jgi:hypothetical protein
MYETPFVMEGKKMGSMEVRTALSYETSMRACHSLTAHGNVGSIQAPDHREDVACFPLHAQAHSHHLQGGGTHGCWCRIAERIEDALPDPRTSQQIILSPIETARDLIKGRSEALQKELSSTSPNTKTLQIVLQGSVLLRTPPFVPRS